MLDESAKSAYLSVPAPDQERTADVLDQLANEFHVSPQRVEQIYVQHLNRLGRRARVRAYVNALATRLTRESLRGNPETPLE
jgi:hypothetical protein